MASPAARLVLALVLALVVVDAAAYAVAVRADAPTAPDAQVRGLRAAAAALAAASSSRPPEDALAGYHERGFTSALLLDAQGRVLAVEGDAANDATLRDALAHAPDAGYAQGAILVRATSGERTVVGHVNTDATRMLLQDLPPASTEGPARAVAAASFGLAAGAAAVVLALAPALRAARPARPAPRRARRQGSRGVTRLPR